MHCLLYYLQILDLKLLNEVKLWYFLTDIMRNDFYNSRIDNIDLHTVYVCKFFFLF